MSRALVAAFVAGIVATAAGQVPPAATAPVDQAVGDLDPHARSFRRVESGLARFDRDTALRPLVTEGWQRAGGVPIDPITGLPVSQQYVYTAPGYRVLMPQAEYLVRSEEHPRALVSNHAPRRDGEYRMIPTANMVYDLVHRPIRLTPHAANAAAMDARVGQPIDGRLQPLPQGSATGNADLSTGPIRRSPRQLLLEHYGVQGRHDQTASRPRPRQRPRSGPQEHVVDQADAPQPGRDQRDDAAGE